MSQVLEFVSVRVVVGREINTIKAINDVLYIMVNPLSRRIGVRS